MRLHVVPNAHPLIPAVATLTVELVARHRLPPFIVCPISDNADYSTMPETLLCIDPHTLTMGLPRNDLASRT